MGGLCVNFTLQQTLAFLMGFLNLHQILLIGTEGTVRIHRRVRTLANRKKIRCWVWQHPRLWQMKSI